MISNLFYLAVGFFLVFAMILDFKKREIPNSISVFILIFGLAAAWLSGFLFQALLACSLFFILALLLFEVRIMGGGDIKLIAALGSTLTFSNFLILNAWAYAFFIGLVFILLGFMIVLGWALRLNFKGSPLVPVILTAWILVKLIFFFIF